MSRTPAQVFALVFGAVLTLAGVLGFFVSASFDVGSDTPRDTLVLFDVNGWHNLVHVASGALGLAVAGSVAAARTYALALGAVYVVVTIAGFIAGDGGTIIGLLPVNTEDNLLHLLIAIAGLGAGIATPEQPPPSTAAA